jgi:cyclic pyranopterin phosphate synthase
MGLPESEPRSPRPNDVARIVEVGSKEVTEREAVSECAITMTPEACEALARGTPKGDPIEAARIAGIMAAKRTPDLVPLCHPIALSSVQVALETAEAEVRITATVRTTDRTGVEMEALTAVSVAALTIYDMCKALDRAMHVERVRLIRKSGGKSGEWATPDAPAEAPA